MLKMSRRARRMDRHHQSRKRPAVNLISLMDIFTILVFFLLVNSSGVQQLPNKKDLRLPTSIAQASPEETLVVMVTPHKILVQGREVADIQQLELDNIEIIAGLEQELHFLRTRNQGDTDAGTGDKAITIMGDEDISFELLSKILSTCRQVDYTRIAFAAIRTTAKDAS